MNHEESFLGPVYVLADGGSFSSRSQLAALFQDRRRALPIEEETGGDHSGPDGGATLPIILPASGIMVRIPLIRSVNAFQPWASGRGAIPACRIDPSIDDLLSGKDVHLDLAFELIARGIHVDSFDGAELGTGMPLACMPAR